MVTELKHGNAIFSIFSISVFITLAVIAVIPETIMSQGGKFELTIVTVVAAVAIIGVVMATSSFRQYLQGRTLLPSTIGVINMQRSVQIKENGDAEWKQLMRIQNIGKNDLTRFSIPIEADIYDQLNSNQDYIEVTSVTIGTYSIAKPDCHNRCYRKVEIAKLHNKDISRERGRIVIPLNEIGNLRPRDEIDIAYACRMVRLFPFRKQIAEGACQIGVGINHQMSAFCLYVSPPDGEDIHILTHEHAGGFMVFDTSADIADPVVTGNTPPPKIDKNKIEWKLTKPKVGYDYNIYFYTTKT